jgi:hypothetical protein
MSELITKYLHYVGPLFVVGYVAYRFYQIYTKPDEKVVRTESEDDEYFYDNKGI